MTGRCYQYLTLLKNVRDYVTPSGRYGLLSDRQRPGLELLILRSQIQKLNMQSYPIYGRCHIPWLHYTTVQLMSALSELCSSAFTCCKQIHGSCQRANFQNVGRQGTTHILFNYQVNLCTKMFEKFCSVAQKAPFCELRQWARF